MRGLRKGRSLVLGWSKSCTFLFWRAEVVTCRDYFSLARRAGPTPYPSLTSLLPFPLRALSAPGSGRTLVLSTWSSLTGDLYHFTSSETPLGLPPSVKLPLPAWVASLNVLGAGIPDPAAKASAATAHRHAAFTVSVALCGKDTWDRSRLGTRYPSGGGKPLSSNWGMKLENWEL